MVFPLSCFVALLFVFEAAAIQLTPGLFGHTAPLTEQGYLAVAALKSNDDMKAYIHRVCESEARYVRDVSELNGFVPFYSGEKGVQSFDGLRKELRSKAWVSDGEGRTAALNENGYQQVAKRNSTAQMTAFARRVLNNFNVHVTDEGAFKGLLMHHSGKVAVQNYDKLKEDLFNSSFSKFLQFPDTGPKVSQEGGDSVEDSAEEPETEALSAKDQPVELLGEMVAASVHSTTEKDEVEDDFVFAFKSFDLDGSGRLSFSELKGLLTSLDKELSEDAVGDLLKEADADGNGEIDAEEFKAEMKD